MVRRVTPTQTTPERDRPEGLNLSSRIRGPGAKHTPDVATSGTSSLPNTRYPQCTVSPGPGAVGQ